MKRPRFTGVLVVAGAGRGRASSAEDGADEHEHKAHDGVGEVDLFPGGHAGSGEELEVGATDHQRGDDGPGDHDSWANAATGQTTQDAPEDATADRSSEEAACGHATTTETQGHDGGEDAGDGAPDAVPAEPEQAGPLQRLQWTPGEETEQADGESDEKSEHGCTSCCSGLELVCEVAARIVTGRAEAANLQIHGLVVRVHGGEMEASVLRGCASQSGLRIDAVALDELHIAVAFLMGLDPLDGSDVRDGLAVRVGDGLASDHEERDEAGDDESDDQNHRDDDHELHEGEALLALSLGQSKQVHCMPLQKSS